MAPAPCTVRYRADLLAAARRALGSVLGRPAYEEGRREGRQDASGGAPFYLAAHVRALPEGRGKSEPAHEWLPRLVNFTSLHCGRRQRHGPGHGPLRPSPCTLYIATDDPAGVLPRAASALEPCAVGALCDVNVTVVSGAAAAGILAPSMLPPRPRHHPTPTALIDVQQQAASEAALLAADVAAVLGARHFSPAPRSGLSVHYTATRACEGVGGAAEHDGWRPAPGTCDPAAAACVPFASSGCGGAFPRLLLEGPPLCSTLRRKARSPGDELCVDSQGVERQYYCP